MGIISKTIDDDILDKLGKLVESSRNQPDKADKIEKWLKDLRFKPLDMGTNRIVYTHKDYSNVVFKISLDEQGILDNLNEYQKSDMSEYFPKSFDIDQSGYILVQQRCPTISIEDFNDKATRKRIRKILEELSERFILIDVGSDKHKNFGKDKKGNIYVIDFGYVEINDLGNFNCPHTRYKADDKVKHCKGTLGYTKDFRFLVCDECDNTFRVDVVLEGYTSTKYETSEKTSWYAPSNELQEFFKSFNKTRDRSTLTKYVELSHNNQKSIEKGEISVSNFREQFLRKIGGQQPAIPAVINKVANEEHVAKEEEKKSIKPLTIVGGGPKSSLVRPYESTLSGVDILKRNEELNSIEESDENNGLYGYRYFARELLKPNLDEDIAAVLLSKLFFEKFPEVKEILEEVQAKSVTTIILEEQITMEETTAISLLEEANIELIQPVNNEHELHIAFDVDTLNKHPWIIMSKGDTVVHIDLVAHMEKISEIDHGDETELIASAIEVKPLQDFDGNYEKHYFEDDDSDHS
jgi:hypothetical protein